MVWETTKKVADAFVNSLFDEDLVGVTTKKTTIKGDWHSPWVPTIWSGANGRRPMGKGNKGNVGYLNTREGSKWLHKNTPGDALYEDPDIKPVKKVKMGSRGIVKQKPTRFEGTTSRHRELKVYNRILDSYHFLAWKNEHRYPQGNTWIVKPPNSGIGVNDLTGSEFTMSKLRLRFQVQNHSFDPVSLQPISMDYRIIVFFDKAPPGIEVQRQMEVSSDDTGPAVVGILGYGPRNFPAQASLFDINPSINKRVHILHDETFVVGPYGYGQMKTHELELDVKGTKVKTSISSGGYLNRAVNNELIIAMIPNVVGAGTNGIIVSIVATIKFYN